MKLTITATYAKTLGSKLCAAVLVCLMLVLSFQQANAQTDANEVIIKNIDGTDYVIHTFNTTGVDYTFTPPKGVSSVEYLLVGGGVAGSILTGTANVTPGMAIDISVGAIGANGAYASSKVTGSQGSSSFFAGLEAFGGREAAGAGLESSITGSVVFYGGDSGEVVVRYELGKVESGEIAGQIITVENAVTIPSGTGVMFVGPVENPENVTFEIGDFSDLDGTLRENATSGANFVQINDIIDVEDFTSIPEFNGSYNGGGFVITNLFAESGLFTLIDGGSISSLGLEQVDMDGGTVGGLAGTINNSSVSEVYITGLLFGEEVGGIAGIASGNSSITDSYSTATINFLFSGGGLVGELTNSSISTSYATGPVNSQFGGVAGGIVGAVDNGTITNSYYNSDTSGAAGAGTALSIRELKKASETEGFDYGTGWNNGVWSIYEDTSYPLLTNVGEHVSAGPNMTSEDAGWRHFGSSIENASYADLTSTLWTQGIPSSSNPGASVANVQVYNTSTNDFDDVTDMNNVAAVGLAYAMFVFEGDDVGGEYIVPEDRPAFPKYPITEGRPYDENTDIVVDANTMANGWTMAANSYLWPVSISAFTNTGLTNIVYVWDPNSNSHLTATNGVGSVEKVPAFQGFLVQTSQEDAGTPSLTIPAGAQIVEGTSDTYHRGSEQLLALNLQVSVNDSPLKSFGYVTFGSEDANEALKLQPVSQRSFVELAFDSNSELRGSRHFSGDLESVIQIPMMLNYFDFEDGNWVGADQNVTLSWSGLDEFSSDWEMKLIDTQTGQVTDLSDTSSLEIALSAEANKNDADMMFAHSLEVTPRSMNKSTQSRFILEIMPGTATSVPGGGELPTELTLSQNYPNPFNPTTLIEYTLPESANVTLEVFNMAGQRVATLQNGTQTAGAHTVSFDAHALSSGIYMYRLQAGSTVMTRKMTLIK